jgi:hypothetical protein
MGIVRHMVLVIGVLAVLTGVIWIGQGTGYFPYPSYSFMINQMSWAYGGAALAIVGVIAVVVWRRL